MRTWHFELAVVAAVLFLVAAISGGRLEIVGACAVTLSFAHAQVADRLAEREASRADHLKRYVWVGPGLIPDRASLYEADHIVYCHRWAARYLVGKELLWLVYFVALGAWSALAGVFLFLAYPLWRKWWRS